MSAPSLIVRKRAAIRLQASGRLLLQAPRPQLRLGLSGPGHECIIARAHSLCFLGILTLDAPVRGQRIIHYFLVDRYKNHFLLHWGFCDAYTGHAYWGLS